MIVHDHFEPSITGVLAYRGPETGLKAIIAILDHAVPTRGQLAAWTTAPGQYALNH